MTATLKLTQMLAEAVNTDITQTVSGSTVAEVLDDLFAQQPGLRGHIVDEAGAVRPHVALFVNRTQAELGTAIPEDAEVYVLHAVSGG